MDVIRPTVIPDPNNLGGVIDGCYGVVWNDDGQIVSGTVVKRYSAAHGDHRHADEESIAVTPEVPGRAARAPLDQRPQVEGRLPHRVDLEDYIAELGEN